MNLYFGPAALHYIINNILSLSIYTLWNSDMIMTTRVYYFMLHHLHFVKLWHDYDYSCILLHATPSTLCETLTWLWLLVYITSCYTIYTLWNSDMAMTTRVYYFMLHHLHCVKLWHGYDYSCILPHATPSTLCGSLIHHVYNNKPCWMFRLNERKPYTACPMLYIHQRVLWFI